MKTSEHLKYWMECKHSKHSQIIQRKDKGGKTFRKTARDECLMFLCSGRPNIGKSCSVVLQCPITVSLGS